MEWAYFEEVLNFGYAPCNLFMYPWRYAYPRLRIADLDILD
jgi:hypothetical protein